MAACQAPPFMRFSMKESWSGLPFPSPGDLPDRGMEPRSPAFQADTLLSKPPGKPISILLLQLSRFSRVRPRGLNPTRLFCPWGFSRQEYCRGLPFRSPGDLPNPGIKPSFPAWQADCLPVGHQLGSFQSFSHVRLFVTSRTAARQASLSITNSRSLLKFMSI